MNNRLKSDWVFVSKHPVIRIVRNDNGTARQILQFYVYIQNFHPDGLCKWETSLDSWKHIFLILVQIWSNWVLFLVNTDKQISHK